MWLVLSLMMLSACSSTLMTEGVEREEAGVRIQPQKLDSTSSCTDSVLAYYCSHSNRRLKIRIKINRPVRP